MSEKKKLTLSVNKEVVDKAKELGINISDITENVLRGFAFTPEGLDDEIIYKKYDELFQVMLPLMIKYNFNIGVASDTEFNENGDLLYNAIITFEPDSAFYVDFFETMFSDITMIKVSDFYPPLVILETFLSKMTNAVEQRSEHIKEIEMAKRIVQAITGTMTEKSGAE